MLLENSGFEAYVVGGAVRDALLGDAPSDWDITTNALPDQIKLVFTKHFDTGIQHGTVTVIVDNFPIEITTYRVDGAYSDSRRPESVSFTKNLTDDLLRRDFTINALAYNHKTGIVDVYGGMEDIQNRIVKCIGNPSDRFNEDALRILRALRFSATLNFKIESVTHEEICRNAELLRNISGERICCEITKLLMADRYIEYLFDSGVGNVILPEVSRCFSVWQNNERHIYDVGNHILEVIYNVPKTPLLRYAALLHDIGKAQTRVRDEWGIDKFPNHATVSANMAREILTRLKMSNKMKLTIVNLVRIHSVKIKPNELSVKRAVLKLGKVEFKDLIEFKRANIAAQSEVFARSELRELDEISEIYQEILDKKHPLHVRDLAVNGNDMKEIGLRSSAIGKKLCLLLMRVIKNPELNTRENLMKIAIDTEKKRKKEE